MDHNPPETLYYATDHRARNIVWAKGIGDPSSYHKPLRGPMTLHAQMTPPDGW